MRRRRSRSPSSGSAKTKPTLEIRDVAVFIFRRDLRLVDNRGLHSLCTKASAADLPVLPLFCFNPSQAAKEQNAFFGEPSFAFMCESLDSLNGMDQLDGALLCLEGSDEDCLHRVQGAGLRIAMLGFNEDFTPFAQVRDEGLQQWCKDRQVTCLADPTDYTLLPLDAIENGAGKPYSVFTPYYRKLMAEHQHQIKKPRDDHPPLGVFLSNGRAYLQKHCTDPLDRYTPNPCASDHGGRQEGLRRLARVASLTDYATTRDDIAGDQTSHLSPHLKFGTVSIREVWHAAVNALGASHAFPRQLIWREFYASLLYHHPQLVGGQLQGLPHGYSKRKQFVPTNLPFQSKYLNYKWDWRPEHWEAFRGGVTGVPLVDAAVRCLTATGWCHNRNRMIIANYLVKTLGVDWRVGEKWFAQLSVDYDVANNSGGWQWSSGQGADPQPYFRTFNPFRQSARFDPECHFIFQWVPELCGIPPSVVHEWDTYCATIRHVPTGSTGQAAPVKGGKKAKYTTRYATAYPAPIVDIKAATASIIAEFKKYDPPKVR